MSEARHYYLAFGFFIIVDSAEWDEKAIRLTTTSFFCFVRKKLIQTLRNFA